MLGSNVHPKTRLRGLRAKRSASTRRVRNFNKMMASFRMTVDAWSMDRCDAMT